MLKTLRAKLISGFLLVSFVSVAVMIGWSIRQSLLDAQNKTRDLLETAANEQYHIIEARLQNLMLQTDFLAQNRHLHSGSNAAILEALDSAKRAIAAADTVFFTNAAGISILNTGRSTIDVSERDYIKRALFGQTSTQIIISKETGKASLAAAAPLRNNNGQVFGTVGIVINIANDPAFSFDYIGQTGERYIVDKTGLFLTSSRFIEDAVFKQEASEQVKAMFQAGAASTYFGNYTDYRGAAVYGAMRYVPTTNWVVVAEMDREEVFDAVFAVGRGLVTLGAIALLFAIAMGTVIAVRIASRIKPVALGSQAVAKGNLSFDFTPIPDNDEVGELSRSFGTMLRDLRDLIQRLQESSSTLAERAGLINGNISEVAAGNDSQASITQEVTRTLEQLAASTEEIAANAQSAASASESARNAATAGAERVVKSIGSLKTVQDSVANLAAVSKQIGGIVSTIEEIANQTNLLALNAAIEAARAGEHGRGFAVVADAVRGLAEQSRQATKEIARLIHSIQEEITEAVSISTEGAEGARLAQEALDNIVSHVNNIAIMVEEISAAGEQQAASANEVAASMENLGAITEQVAASSQETAAATTHLAQLGLDLNNMTKRFKL